MSAELGIGATARAAELDSAIEALDFETEPLQKVASARLKKTGAHPALFCRMPAASGCHVSLRIYHWRT